MCVRIGVFDLNDVDVDSGLDINDRSDPDCALDMDGKLDVDCGFGVGCRQDEDGGSDVDVRFNDVQYINHTPLFVVLDGKS